MNKNACKQTSSRPAMLRGLPRGGMRMYVATLLMLGVWSATGAVPPSTGGPDAFGYIYTDSRNSAVPYNFVDIAASGTRSTASDGDDVFEAVDIGFEFTFYENKYPFCFITSNGQISFGAGTLSYLPWPIPRPGIPDNFIAGFATDLNPTFGGTIYYKTIGSAPNRIFIVQYDNVAQHLYANVKATFQVQLFESSNKIEVHYEKIDPGTATGSATVVGLENIDGTVGLQYHFRVERFDFVPEFPVRTKGVIRFDRSVKLTVESKYTKPNGTVVDLGVSKVSPPAGLSNIAYDSVQRFEAPEFIYLNRNFQELSTVGNASDPDPNKVAYYRARCVGYAIDGQSVQGVERFFERTITEDIKVIWRWELEYAVIIDSTTGDGGFGSPAPPIGRSWYGRDTEFSAQIDSTVEAGEPGTRFKMLGYETRNPFGTLTSSVELSAETGVVRTPPSVITDAFRLAWLWDKQVRYRFDAQVLEASGTRYVNGEPFVRVYNAAGANPVTYFGPTGGSVGAGPNVDVWIPTGRKVDVGCFYRTFDRRVTLSGPSVENPDVFAPSPTGDLPTDLKLSRLRETFLKDSMGRTRLARIHTVPSVTAPSAIHWLFGPTVFRAILPLGEGLDAVAPDAVLVPVLPDGTPELRKGAEGPGTAFDGPNPGLAEPGTPEPGAAEWDQVGQVLFPVHPGNYRVNWPDANLPVTTYTIETVSGLPGKTMRLSSPLENAAGERMTTTTFVSEVDTPAALDGYGQAITNGAGAPLYYVETVTTDPIDDSFPGAPTAHYRHLYDSDASRRPPTRLDISTTDRWAFQRRTFAESSVGGVIDSAGTRSFSAAGRGRTVLLFSYRPNPDEVANGDRTKERLAVRIVRSDAIAPVFPKQNALGLQALRLGENALGLIRTGTTPTSFSPGKHFSVDFWVNYERASSNAVLVDLGSIPLTVSVNPGAGTISADYYTINVTRALPASKVDWHHVIVHVFESVLGGLTPRTSLVLYIDGVPQENARLNSEAGVPGSPPSLTVATTVQATGLRLGVGAVPEDGLRLDGLRLYTYAAKANAAEAQLSFATREFLRTGAGAAPTVGPLLRFDFETAPVSGRFANEGTTASVAIGTFTGDVRERVNLQEVATRLQNVLDRAGFGSGYVLNERSNYNADLYRRDAEVGTWGPVFPVNDRRLFQGVNAMEVAYYENPYQDYPDSIEHLHPNVAWPYAAVDYFDVHFPSEGPHRDKRIVIASRIGSEGVDENGRPQPIFDLAHYANLAIYNQPDTNAPGYNPNEEHALAASSYRAALKVKNLGEALANNPPLAAFALQYDRNVTAGEGYTSDRWVLIQVDNLKTGEPEMAAYRVDAVRDGTVPFPRPLDSELTAGLAYESAANPDDRFLTIDASVAHDFDYQFEYPVFAGDLLVPPYPLNLVVGNVTMRDDRGRNLKAADGSVQRTFWKDVGDHAWIVSGGGRFSQQFFYPYRSDFYLPGVQPGTPVAWMPSNAVNGFVEADVAPVSTNVVVADLLNPVDVLYHSSWRSDYPKLKRGETLTYQGGEYFNENPGSDGLPALVAMGAAEIVFDSGTPDMVLHSGNLSNESARVIRPLDPHEARFTTAQMQAATFSPASPAIFVVAERWYFSDLPGSLQRRFYFDSLAEKLVFRGYLNDKDSGAPDLTAGPDPLNVLEPNVMTRDERAMVLKLSADPAWQSAVEAIYQSALNPTGVRALNDASVVQEVTNQHLAGLMESPAQTLNLGLTQEVLEKRKESFDSFEEAKAAYAERYGVYHEFATYYEYQVGVAFGLYPSGYPRRPAITPLPDQPVGIYAPLSSFGVGAALVCNPNLLTRSGTESLYVTIAENNRTELDGAPVSLHIIEIVPDRYRGAIKVIEAANAFSEKVTLQHNAEFGGNTSDLYYEWWIRDAAALDVVAEEVFADGTLKEFDDEGHSLWQEYVPKNRAENDDLTPEQKHLGSHTIIFEGRPDVVLADKLVLMRYRHRSETDWNLVPFELTQPAAVAWQSGSPAPFQWAGAANSPQLQADGSKRYIPQLVMGWVKRVLDRINPYEARYNDFFGNESPAVYSSQIQIAGPPYAGAVALNPDKNVIENTGLIELYETVLDRAKSLSIDNSSNPQGTDGINQALLLAATRLSVLYELLAREAYSDAQDATIRVTDGDGLAGVASFTHAFQNQEADLLHEELALLRGTDFRKSYPVFNRMFWNYVKGLGEAAYNVNYNIYDETGDGFINEDDARALYPQGHGDAWGYFVTALDKHYELLRHPVFQWNARAELYSLMQNVIEADYLDEKTFAKLAAGKARTGRDIVRATYRVHYTQDPDGQWQGYEDRADPARAWGVSEWAHRAGQSAYFDWAVANALLPADAVPLTTNSTPENLDHLDRLSAEDEIGEVAGALYEIQTAMDEANGGANPLGFDADAMAFDIDPYLDGVNFERSTHFEQIYERALGAGNNALALLDFAAQTDNKLRHIADDTDELVVEAFRQDLDYRNRLIEIFGRPYDGQIGFGKAYPEGYEGPDTMLFAYLDRTKVDQIIPPGSPSNYGVLDFGQIKIKMRLYDGGLGLSDNETLTSLYYDVSPDFTDDDGEAQLAEAFKVYITGYAYQDPTEFPMDLPVRRTSDYAFQAPENWGVRTSYGRVQQILEDMLLEEIALKQATDEYIAFLGDFHTLALKLDSELARAQRRGVLNDRIADTRKSLNTIILAQKSIEILANSASAHARYAANNIKEGIPEIVGFSNSVGSPGKAAVAMVGFINSLLLTIGGDFGQIAALATELIRDEVIADIETNLGQIDQIAEIEGLMADIELFSGDEGPKRALIASHMQSLEIKRQEYVTAQAEGFRLLKEREAFNKILAASAQRNRYEDMVWRLARNEAMAKYQSAFNHAARYTWLTARAYDYETSLDAGHPAAAGALLDKIVKERQLGLWSDGEPQVGQGGLGEILAMLNGNFGVLRGQLGLNNPQSESEKISLRRELFRIAPAADGRFESDRRWKEALLARKVDNLFDIPEFVRYCRPGADPADGAQPGLVIRFSTTIEPGRNLFGNALAGGDHTYSVANFATKIRGFGVWLDGYDDAALATTPRAYLVPVGNDIMRVSTADLPTTRTWSVVEQRIPTPFTINAGQITSPGFMPSLDGVDGSFSALRRHGDFRMYHNAGDTVDESELILVSRLVGRSVWNSDWLLIIPGAGLEADPDRGLETLAESITDIKLFFETYSHQGL